MFENKTIRLPLTLKADGPEGSVRAVFSRFDVVDKDGDIVLASAFTHGQAVPMTWAHRWDMPVGKGIVLVEADHALFDGGFFMETDAGAEAYRTVKAMGPLQEWSWGFRVTDASFEQRDGEYIRIIKGAQVFEVSPVLVGAGENTYTMGIKGTMPLADQSEAVLAAVRDWAERIKSLAGLRQKEGRAISTARRTQMAGIADQLETAATDLRAVLKETEPPEKGADLSALWMEYQAIVARQNGVPV